MNRLRYMIGPYLDVDDKRSTDGGFRGWCVGFGFYWFRLMFFKSWDPDIRYGSGRPCAWTGFVFYYKPNPELKEGDLIWLKCKKWMWADYE